MNDKAEHKEDVGGGGIKDPNRNTKKQDKALFWIATAIACIVVASVVLSIIF